MFSPLRLRQYGVTWGKTMSKSYKELYRSRLRKHTPMSVPLTNKSWNNYQLGINYYWSKIHLYMYVCKQAL